jgi:hypothetical protein
LPSPSRLQCDGLGALVGLALKVLLQRLPAVIYLLLLF